jgi:4-hydroxyphenylpyruvate dioxygenase
MRHSSRAASKWPAVRTSIATVSVSGSLEEKLEAIAAAGFWGVEIFENDLLSYSGSPRDVARLMRSLGLVCTAYQPFRDFEGMPEALRAQTFERLERKFDVMHGLGAQLLLVCSNVSPLASGDRQQIIADFRELGDRAAARGITVGYEALAWGRHINDHRDAWAVVREANHPAVGLILDSFHSFARQVPVESLQDIDPAKIVLVQLADAPKLHMDELSWSRHFRTMPGQGDFPLVNYVGTLHDIGFRGVYSLEIFNDRFRAAAAETIARDGKRSLTYLEDEISRRRGRTPSLPARVSCRGVEFLEFAANEVEAPQLGRMLASLGFNEVGRHKRKAVSRWRQGDINIVINSESEGFAHRHDLVHGASVCAIGLRVDRREDVLSRARALQIETFSQPVTPGEYELPALRGVGGSLLYLIESASAATIWADEFVRVAETADTGAGLRSVDHFAQVMQYEDMFSWLLFYVSLFDIAKTPMIEFADPLGLVQSQAIESPDGKLRITLNASAANQTLSARFLRSYTGAGVQYVAFSTDDIFHSSTEMRRRGIELLSIPRNYYADLRARFGLDDAVVDQMAQANILYDRSESGEFFHYYSRAFAKRFFFEVVQRRSYAGYGAPNESIRLAAQARFKSAPAQ